MRRAVAEPRRGARVKFYSFHLMPYRYLPDDFRDAHHSVWVDIPAKLLDPQKTGELYDEYIDELIYASTLGYDGICVNEHHQNGYGLMPSPNIIAATLARETKDVAIVLLGDSIALYNPPTRVAEEVAMLDCMSGGRIVAGFPVGTSMDTNYCYGQNPVTLRDKYREAEQLIISAWTEQEPFAFNGRYTQLRYVNIWPRPIQQPHPPIWIPGGGSVETWDWVCQQGHMYAALSFSGFERARRTFEEFWPVVDSYDLPRNPYRAGVIQFIGVADNEQMAAALYGEHLEWFYNKTQHVYGGFIDAPGYRTENTIAGGFTTHFTDTRITERSWAQLVDERVVIQGSPSQVTEQLEALIEEIGIGVIMVMAHFGSMPRETSDYNMRRIAQEVIPKLRHLHSEWEDEWYPQHARRAPGA